MTRVCIDASQLSGQSNASGIGTYVRNLLEGLSAIPGLDVHALAETGVELPQGTRRRTIQRFSHQGRPAVYEHELRRTLELRSNRAQVFHNPNPHAPRLPPRRWIQTLHDVIPLVFDDPVAEGLRRRFERFGPRYAAADRVIAVSRHAADEGIRLLGIDPKRIEVVHHGVGAEFRPGPRATPDPPYVLMVSEYSRRKGLAEALGVLDALVDAGLPHRLALAGRVPPWVRQDFEGLVLRSANRDRVNHLGFVEDLPALYRGADAVLVTSRYEGFGLPALEAMACGVPVVAFANTALPEVIGDGGILVPDGDVPAFARALLSLLELPAAQEEARERALQRAGEFTWRRSAAAHADIYTAVAE